MRPHMGTIVAAAMARVAVVLAAVSAVGFFSQNSSKSWQSIGLPPLSFVAHAGPAAPLTVRPTQMLFPSMPPVTGRAASDEEAPAQPRSRCALGMAAVVLAAVGLAAQRRRDPTQRGVHVGMRSRRGNHRWNGKGLPPMINRPIARDMIDDTMQGWIKKYKKSSDIENIVKKTIYGKVQFQFSSEHFTDDIPYYPLDGKSGGRDQGNDSDHHPEIGWYKRKYLEPAKFKKLEIVNWEMPENYTRVVTLPELVNAGMQYGHASGSWNPKMLQYIYSDNDGTHIFDLVQTAAMLNRACYYCFEAALKGATFLFAGTKEQAQPLIAKVAKRLNQNYCDRRFVGGLLTNFEQVQKGVQLLNKMKVQSDQGVWKIESEQQQEKNTNKLKGLRKKYTGVQNMTDLPDIMIMIDAVKERDPIQECQRLGIPVIGMCDSNADPTFVDLPIPGNCSGSRAIELVLTKLEEAILKGQKFRADTQPADREVIEKEWDPWIFSRDRLRMMRRRSKRQPWHKVQYGSYEKFKKAHPFGNINAVAPFEKFSWKA